MEWKTHVGAGVLCAIAGMAVFGTGGIRYLDAILWTVAWALVPLAERHLPLSHRSPALHSVFTALAAAAAVYALSFVADLSLLSLHGAAFAAVGIGSHILVDSFTTTGVPLAYPLLRRRHVLFPYAGHRLRYADDAESGRVQYAALLLLIGLLVLEALGLAPV